MNIIPMQDALAYAVIELSSDELAKELAKSLQANVSATVDHNTVAIDFTGSSRVVTYESLCRALMEFDPEALLIDYCRNSIRVARHPEKLVITVSADVNTCTAEDADEVIKDLDEIPFISISHPRRYSEVLTYHGKAPIAVAITQEVSVFDIAKHFGKFTDGNYLDKDISVRLDAIVFSHQPLTGHH